MQQRYGYLNIVNVNKLPFLRGLSLKLNIEKPKMINDNYCYTILFEGNYTN